MSTTNPADLREVTYTSAAALESGVETFLACGWRISGRDGEADWGLVRMHNPNHGGIVLLSWGYDEEPSVEALRDMAAGATAGLALL